jgi:putative ABC transport system permease protein
MLRNYLITAFRNFKNNRFYTFINVFGLSIGLTCCLVVYSIIKHERTFDSWHKNGDRIYRVVEHYMADWGMNYNGVMPNPLPQTVVQEGEAYFEDVISLAGPETFNIHFEFEGKNMDFQELDNVVYANSSFLKQMDFPIIRGAGPEALDEPYKIFLAEKVAKKYFGNDNPIGKYLTVDEHYKMEVVGILQDIPTNTNVPFELLVSYPTIIDINESYMNSWGAYWSGTLYVVLKEGQDPDEMAQYIESIREPHVSARSIELKSYHLQPLSEIHTDVTYGDGVNYVSPIEIVIGFVLLASITLIASVLNFINLSTAQAVKRSKEIGIRKTLGSSRRQLIIQFLSETFIIVSFSMLLAFTFGQFFIDLMNSYLSLVAFEIGYDVSSIVFAIGLGLIVSVLAGFYPAMIISGYNPIGALHNQISIAKGSGKVSLRKALVIGQFVIANLLIITTIIVASQMQYVKNKDLGFNRDRVVSIDFPGSAMKDLPVILEEFKSKPFVEKAVRQFATPQANYNWNTNYEVIGEEVHDKLSTNIKFIDQGYLDLYQIPLIAGTNIRAQYTSDSTHQLIVSREFLKRVAINDPQLAIGRKVKFLGKNKGTIVGVVEDFNNWSLNSRLGPVIMYYDPQRLNQIAIKLKDDRFGEYLPEIESVFRDNVPVGYYEARLFDDEINQSYLVENLVYGAFQIFAVMAILIALLGLYGLVAFIANQKRKSISIRKVFGASPMVILRMFGTEYILLMMIAFVLAAPLSYLMSDEWLSGFYYRIDITAIYFIISFLLIILITASTVAIKSYQTASANPVDALRHE